MRHIAYSNTFDRQIADYIEQGELSFGVAVTTAKKNLVYSTIRNILASNPGVKRADPKLGLVVYPISKTPFFVVYDYDDVELRMHFIFINGKPLDTIDPSSAVW